jgi:hypothetical protein
MEIKTDKYTKIILTIIAVTLVLILFRPEVQKMVAPQNAYARPLPGILDTDGRPLSVSDVVVRNSDTNTPVPVVASTVIKVQWDKPMPVYIVNEKEKSK